jgi:hypothetical protein
LNVAIWDTLAHIYIRLLSAHIRTTAWQAGAVKLERGRTASGSHYRHYSLSLILRHFRGLCIARLRQRLMITFFQHTAERHSAYGLHNRFIMFLFTRMSNTKTATATISHEEPWMPSPICARCLHLKTLKDQVRGLGFFLVPKLCRVIYFILQFFFEIVLHTLRS